MNTEVIKIDFSLIDSHREVISCFHRAQIAGKGGKVELILDFSTKRVFVHSDHLLAIVALVNHLLEMGIDVNVVVEGKCDYASRVNFFKLLGIPYEEHFVRRGSVGRFIELSKFTNETTYSLQDHLTMLLHQLPIAKEVKELMFYCLGEIMDNVLLHSGLKHGWVCAQFYPSRREMRLMICDNGMGVRDALRNGAREEYTHINEAEALKLCIQRGVTNGQGLGFGLYATSKFIQLNKGEMLLYSGHHCLEMNGEDVAVSEVSFWPGTLVAMRTRTNVPVNYKDVMPANHTLPDDYQFFIDQFFGENNELW